jgi:phosphatidylglycerol:prolipoprotein diacylglycerol transferase
MRPILVNIPSKMLFFVALGLAVAVLARDLIRRRGDRTAPWNSWPLYFLGGAAALLYFKADTLIPSAAAFSHPWTPVPIYAYGVMLGTSLVVGWFIAMHLAGKDGIDQQEAGTIYMWTAVWSIVGSRLLWYFTTPEATIGQIPLVNQGGLVAYGGMIGGFLASVFCCRRRGIPLLQWADVAAPSVVLGTAITRIGCFLFGCDYGARSSLPWAVKFPGPNDLAPHGSPAWQHHVANYGLSHGAAWSYPVHPTQLYESLVGLSLFGLLMLIRKYRTFSGQVFIGWVVGYGVLRSLIERYRDDDDRGVYNLFGNVTLSTSQIIGIVSTVLGIGLLVYLITRYRRDPASLRLWEHVPVAAKVDAQSDSKKAKVEEGGGKRRKRR